MLNLYKFVVSQIAFLIILIGFIDVNAQVTSSYTKINDEYCKSVDEGLGNGNLFRAECKGIGGYKVIYWEGESSHQEIYLKSPSGKILGPDLMKISMIPYSEVGAELEWRVKYKNKKPIPYALIVKYKTLAVPDSEPEFSIPEKNYLVIVKIKGETACITDFFQTEKKDEKAKARKLADQALQKPCYVKEDL